MMPLAVVLFIPNFFFIRDLDWLIGMAGMVAPFDLMSGFSIQSLRQFLIALLRVRERRAGRIRSGRAHPMPTSPGRGCVILIRAVEVTDPVNTGLKRVQSGRAAAGAVDAVAPPQGLPSLQSIASPSRVAFCDCHREHLLMTNSRPTPLLLPRQFALMKRFQWYGLVCYWQHIVHLIARSIFDTTAGALRIAAARATLFVKVPDHAPESS